MLFHEIDTVAVPDFWDKASLSSADTRTVSSRGAAPRVIVLVEGKSCYIQMLLYRYKLNLLYCSLREIASAFIQIRKPKAATCVVRQEHNEATSLLKAVILSNVRSSHDDYASTGYWLVIFLSSHAH